MTSLYIILSLDPQNGNTDNSSPKHLVEYTNISIKSGVIKLEAALEIPKRVFFRHFFSRNKFYNKFLKRNFFDIS